jgi:hypothetical protein
MKHFSGKNKTSGLGTTLLKHQIIRISKLSDIGLKECCCMFYAIPVSIANHSKKTLTCQATLAYVDFNLFEHHT